MSGDSDLTQLRIDVAEMRGMLSQALSDHGQRITGIEADNRTLHGRLSDKGKTLATHAEHFTAVDKAIYDLEQANLGFAARVALIIGSVAGLGGLGLAIVNALRI